MPREIALLTNPTAGRGRGRRARDAAVARLRSVGIAVRSLEGSDPDQALALAHEQVAAGVDALVVCGGDGMVNLGAQAAAGTGTPLGIIPAGTGNDVARALDIPRKDPATAAERVIAGNVRTIDLARSLDRYYVTVMAAGFDAVVNERANAMTWPRGPMRYNVATVAELRTFRPLPYILELDGTVVHTSAMLVAIGNGPSFGGGIRICEGASMDDGLLDVVVINPVSKGKLLRVFPKLYQGTHTTLPEFERHRVREVTASSPGIVAYGDGERLGPLPMTTTVQPGALRVFAPPAP